MISGSRDTSNTTSAGARDRFAADVGYYLTLQPRQLPSRYLYDALGSALFEAICHLPWYPLTRSERGLIETHARSVVTEDVSTIVELGPGSGEKLSLLVAAAGVGDRALEAHLVDVSSSALALARRTVAAHDNVRVITHEARYEAGLEAFAVGRQRPGRALALFLGSNIGNFDPPAREAFVRTVRTALDPGDTLVLGADLVRPERDLLLAYDDPLGVTAAFNRNLLVRINRELGGDFDLEAFSHRAVWNAAESRVEMHLVVDRAQTVRIPGAELTLELHAGEAIWTESSYKFTPEHVRTLLECCGFAVSEQWVDDAHGFALTSGAVA